MKDTTLRVFCNFSGGSDPMRKVMSMIIMLESVWLRMGNIVNYRYIYFLAVGQRRGGGVGGGGF